MVVAESVTCVRGEKVIFRDLSLQVASGAALQIFGANGSGKSSLLRVLAGLLPTAAGTISIDGVALAECDRSLFAYLGHKDGLRPAVTAREAVIFAAALKGRASDAADAALATVQLTTLAARFVRQLSQGQRRRVALACIVASGAKLWLLDEPLNGLDADAQTLLTALLARHVAQDGTALIATHKALALDSAQLVLG